MKKLLCESCDEVNKRETGVLSEAECRKYRKRYRTILTQGGKEMPEIPKRRDGKRGRIAKSDAHNLHEALLILEESVLRFMSDPDVSFTNNTGEQKSGCQRSKSKSRGTSGQNATHTPGAGYRVISRFHESTRIQSTRRHPDRVCRKCR